jgi:hypothetical protein
MAGTDLFIQWSTANPVDKGDRPLNPCGPPNYYWANQSIWLTDPNDPNTTLNQATVGEEIQINVRATNKQSGATFQSDGIVGLLTMQIWVCDYAIAVGPNGGIASAGGAGGISSQRLTTLVAGGQAAFSGRWTPAAGDLSIHTTSAGEGHVCIAANIIWEGSPPANESHSFPPPGSLSLCGDGVESVGGHHGQRNILIAPSGTPKMKIEMNVINLGPRTQPFIIQVAEAGGMGALRLAERAALLAEDWVIVVGGKVGRVRVRMDGDQPLEPYEQAKLRLGGRLVLKGSKKPIQIARTPVRNPLLTGKGIKGSGKVEIKVSPKKPERIALEFERPASESPGTVHVFDVTQRDTAGHLLGGSRIMTVTQ